MQGRDPYGVALAAITLICLACLALLISHVKAWAVGQIEDLKEEFETTRREERRNEASRRALQGRGLDEVRLALREWRRRSRIPADVDTHVHFNLVIDRLPNDPPARPVLHHFLDDQAVEADDRDLKGYIRKLSLLHVPDGLRKIDTLKMKG